MHSHNATITLKNLQYTMYLSQVYRKYFRDNFGAVVVQLSWDLKVTGFIPHSVKVVVSLSKTPNPQPLPGPLNSCPLLHSCVSCACDGWWQVNIKENTTSILNQQQQQPTRNYACREKWEALEISQIKFKSLGTWSTSYFTDLCFVLIIANVNKIRSRQNPSLTFPEPNEHSYIQTYSWFSQSYKPDLMVLLRIIKTKGNDCLKTNSHLETWTY